MEEKNIADEYKVRQDKLKWEAQCLQFKNSIPPHATIFKSSSFDMRR